MSKPDSEQATATRFDRHVATGVVDLEADVATMRAALNDLMARIPVAGDVDHVPTTIGGVNAVDVTIRGIDTANTILYFHGGVYVIGSAAHTVPLVSDLARRAQAKAVTVDYRLAPEHPYPAAVDDARAALRGAARTGRRRRADRARRRVGRWQDWRWPRSSRCETPEHRSRAARS